MRTPSNNAFFFGMCICLGLAAMLAQSGQSSVVLKADGSVEVISGGDMSLTSARNLNLTGNNINIKASADLVMKDSKVKPN